MSSYFGLRQFQNKGEFAVQNEFNCISFPIKIPLIYLPSKTTIPSLGQYMTQALKIFFW